MVVRLNGSAEWKIEKVEQRLKEVWQDTTDPTDVRAKVKDIQVERLVDWGQSQEDKQDLWKAVVSVCPEIDFPAGFEKMVNEREKEGVKLEMLVREELRSGSQEEEEEKTVDSKSCMCSCHPQVIEILKTHKTESFLCSRLHHRGEAKKESAFLQKEKAGFWSLVLLILIRCLFLFLWIL